MMSRAKIAVVALAGSLAFGAVAASCASAADEWFVNGTRLTGSAALAEEAKLDALETLLAPGLPLVLGCEGPLLLLGAYIHNPGILLVRQFDARNCFLLAPAECSLASSTTTTEGSDIQGIATLAPGGGGAGRLTVKTASAVLTTLEIVGASCAIAGEQPTIGEFTFGVPGVATESETHALEGLGSTENNSYIVGIDHVYLEGAKALLRLASGSKWSFHA